MGKQETKAPAKKTGNIAKAKKLVKGVKKGVKVEKVVTKKIWPWFLVAFGAAAYYFFDVPIPEKKKPKVKKSKGKKAEEA